MGTFDGRSAGIGNTTGAFSANNTIYGMNYTSGLGGVKMYGATFSATSYSNRYSNSYVEVNPLRLSCHFYIRH